MSADDIQPGERWSMEIAKQLEESDFGILCITSDNLQSPWIMFEAGALAKSLERGRVIPLLLDVDVQSISGPLAQFQAKKIDEQGLQEIAAAINSASDNPLETEVFQKVTAAILPQLTYAISNISIPEESKRSSRPPEEVLEEVVTTTRSLQQRMQELTIEVRELSGRPLGSPPSASNALSGFRSPIPRHYLSRLSEFKRKPNIVAHRIMELYDVCKGISGDAADIAFVEILRTLEAPEHQELIDFHSSAEAACVSIRRACAENAIRLTEADITKIENAVIRVFIARSLLRGVPPKELNDPPKGPSSD